MIRPRGLGFCTKSMAMCSNLIFAQHLPERGRDMQIAADRLKSLRNGGLFVSEFDSITHHLIALLTLYKISFGSNSMRTSVRPQNGGKRRDAVDGAATPAVFLRICGQAVHLAVTVSKDEM